MEFSLSTLEADLLDELGRDDHALYEVFFFVRLHHSGASDAEVLEIGRELLTAWLERGWLKLSEEGRRLEGGVSEILAVIDQAGVTVTYGIEDPPWVSLSAVGESALDLWLNGSL